MSSPRKMDDDLAEYGLNTHWVNKVRKWYSQLPKPKTGIRKSKGPAPQFPERLRIEQSGMAAANGVYHMQDMDSNDKPMWRSATNHIIRWVDPNWGIYNVHNQDLYHTRHDEPW